MGFPTVGIVAFSNVWNYFEHEAVNLGIKVKFNSERISTDELIQFADGCDLLCVDPNLIPLSTIKTVEKSGVKIYPSSKTLELLSQIEIFEQRDESISILVARSAHTQVSSWTATLRTNNLSITPAPGIADEQMQEIQLAALKLADEIGLIGGIELVVDANEYKNLYGINWLSPSASYWSQIGSTTNYFEQVLRAVLDLPLGSTDLNSKFVLTGRLTTNPKSDDYRPYLHLMARTPALKFNQVSKEIAICGDDLENLLTEIIHAQQYYSGDIDE